MASRAKDLTGLRFGNLIVLRRSDAGETGRARWMCRCDCGGDVAVLAYNLTSGAQHRCSSCASKAQAAAITKHGASGSRLYKVWADMVQRCGNPNRPNYRYYGGKGVKVCASWGSFDEFKAWAESAGYSDALTIDRIDPSGDYEPNNCQWVTRAENSRRSAVNRHETGGVHV